MIIGFGSGERDAALSIINDCAEAMKTNGALGLKAIQTHYQDARELYKTMPGDEAPERYSYFWALHHPIYEGKYFVEFTFHHINRRHALSPDGWALTISRWILSVDPHDGNVFYCADLGGI